MHTPLSLSLCYKNHESPTSERGSGGFNHRSIQQTDLQIGAVKLTHSLTSSLLHVTLGALFGNTMHRTLRSLARSLFTHTIAQTSELAHPPAGAYLSTPRGPSSQTLRSLFRAVPECCEIRTCPFRGGNGGSISTGSAEVDGCLGVCGKRTMVQTSPLTVTPARVAHYSCSDNLLAPRRIILFYKS